jgi:transcriptional repressor NrdR
LRELDPVAYVRFASVYRDFRDASDFQAVLRDIASDLSDRRLRDDTYAAGSSPDVSAAKK